MTNIEKLTLSLLTIRKFCIKDTNRSCPECPLYSLKDKECILKCEEPYKWEIGKVMYLAGVHEGFDHGLASGEEGLDPDEYEAQFESIWLDE